MDGAVILPENAKVLSQGAEGVLYLTPFFGKEAVCKERFAKKYRHPELDVKLTRTRLVQEARALERVAKLGIRVPTLYFVDEVGSKIYMEYFPGCPTVKAALNAKDLTPERKQAIAVEMGRVISIMHKHGIVHGDLTTSNMLVDPPTHLFGPPTHSPDGALHSIALIDFGLTYFSESPEDKAVDLYVLERAIQSTHPLLPELPQAILESYKQHWGGCSSVLQKLAQVRLRGRKRVMVG